jgi:replicative DNA helicase Mcm
MKTKVEEDDANRAIFLFEQMLENAGIDVNTGKVDLGVLQGRPRSEVSKLQTFMDTLKMLEGEPKQAVDEGSFVDELVKTGKFDEDEAKKYIRKMIQEASIVETQPGKYNTI